MPQNIVIVFGTYPAMRDGYTHLSDLLKVANALLNSEKNRRVSVLFCPSLETQNIKFDTDIDYEKEIHKTAKKLISSKNLPRLDLKLFSGEDVNAAQLGVLELQPEAIMVPLGVARPRELQHWLFHNFRTIGFMFSAKNNFQDVHGVLSFTEEIAANQYYKIKIPHWTVNVPIVPFDANTPALQKPTPVQRKIITAVRSSRIEKYFSSMPMELLDSLINTLEKNELRWTLLGIDAPEQLATTATGRKVLSHPVFECLGTTADTTTLYNHIANAKIYIQPAGVTGGGGAALAALRLNIPIIAGYDSDIIHTLPKQKPVVSLPDMLHQIEILAALPETELAAIAHDQFISFTERNSQEHFETSLDRAFKEFVGLPQSFIDNCRRA